MKKLFLFLKTRFRKLLSHPEPKPCPRCGGTSLIVNTCQTGYQIRCRGCHLHTLWFPWLRDAISNWNDQVRYRNRKQEDVYGLRNR